MTLFTFLISLMQSAVAVDGLMPQPISPPGLHVELQTAGNQTTFHLSELVPLQVVFRAAKPQAYSIEIADGWNEAPAADRFLVAPGQHVIDRRRWRRGIACCQSRQPFIPTTPIAYDHELTDFLRFTQPGEYRIQYTTRRVFIGSGRPTYEPSTVLIRTNVLTLRIIEDDSASLAQSLQTALADIDPAPSLADQYQAVMKLPARGSVERPRHGEHIARFTKARRVLRQLDSPQAIRERVARLRMPTVEEWRASERHGGYQGIDDAVAYSSRPDLVAAALRERASAPEFGVTRGYFELWVGILMERDFPSAYRLSTHEARESVNAAQMAEAKAREVLELLRELNKRKSAIAAEITSATIRSVERDLAK